MTSARRGTPTTTNHWYFREWMFRRGYSQTQIVELTGLNPSTVSQLYNRKQDYSPRIVALLADAFEIEVFELFMHPTQALAFREIKRAATTIVELMKSPL